MKKELYQAMVNRLREITNENTQECVFKDLGLWKPEILNEVSNLSDKRPAIFIEFLPIIWKAPCSGVQNGNVQIRLHIIGTESTELEKQSAITGFGRNGKRTHRTLAGLRLW